ncbi:MAG: hypothetical protein K6B65_06190 [Bacilli bacterium]|nr:hypothetical protein [Bacilli bacterium]
MAKFTKLSGVAAFLTFAATLASCGGHKSIAYEVNLATDISGAKITMWTSFGSEMEAITESLIEEWSEKTGVNVVIEQKSGYDNLKSAVIESATSVTYPHITFGYPDHFASYVNSDILVRLDYYFENGATTKFDYAPAGDEFKTTDFYADYMRENQTIEYDESGKGYTLGVPFNKSTECLTYNSTFFDWAKTKDAAIVVPETWAQFETVSQKILDLLGSLDVYGHCIGVDGNVYTDNSAATKATGKDALLDFKTVQDPTNPKSNKTSMFRVLGRDSTSNFFINTIRQWGGTYTIADKATRKGYIKFDSPEAKAGLSKMQEYYNKAYLGIAPSWGEAKYCSNPFTALGCVMTIGSSAGADSNAPKGDKFAISSAPIFYKDADKKYVISQGTNLCLLDTGTEKERVAAWELLKYLSKYNNGEFAAESGYFPACPYAYNSEEYQEFLTARAVSTVDKINLAAAKVNSEIYINEALGWDKFVDQPFDGSSTIRSKVGDLMTSFLIDGKTADQIVADGYSQLSDYVQ